MRIELWIKATICHRTQRKVAPRMNRVQVYKERKQLSSTMMMWMGKNPHWRWLRQMINLESRNENKEQDQRLKKRNRKSNGETGPSNDEGVIKVDKKRMVKGLVKMFDNFSESPPGW